MGKGNIENGIVASIVGRIFGISDSKIKESIGKFRGVEHRLEDLGEKKGRRFINDSKATNIDSVKMALNSISPPIILIMGGKDKGFSYEPLKQIVKKKVKILILLGETREKIAGELKGTREILLVKDIKEAVETSCRKSNWLNFDVLFYKNRL